MSATRVGDDERSDRKCELFSSFFRERLKFIAVISRESSNSDGVKDSRTTLQALIFLWFDGARGLRSNGREEFILHGKLKFISALKLRNFM